MRKANASTPIMVRTGPLGRLGQTENDEEGRFQTMTTYEHAPVSRWLKAIGLLVLATAVLAVAGCGGSDTPAVCDSLETLSGDVDGLKDIDLKDGGAAAAVLRSRSTRSERPRSREDGRGGGALRADRRSRDSLKALSTHVDAMKTAGGVSAESVTALGDAVAAVGTSREALKTAAPDCDL